jgi:hypothetical protein
MDGCNFCKNGKRFQWIPVTATIAVYNYILGNELRTVIDFSYYDQTNIKRITHCPFCGTEVHEAPDEEMEEEE